MTSVVTSVERRRGCGYRRGGGIYVVSAAAVAHGCTMLPKLLDVCPTCHAGFKPTRSWTTVDIDDLLPTGPHDDRSSCPFNGGMGEGGLLWIGERFYSPEEFLREAKEMGVSRRLSQVPKDLEVGKTWVVVAHRHACPADIGEGEVETWESTMVCVNCGKDTQPAFMMPRGFLKDPYCKPCFDERIERRPGVFAAFRPTRLEYVLKGTETDAELERLESRGLTLVKVVRDDGKPLDAPADDDEF